MTWLLLAYNKEAIKDMMGTLRKFLKSRSLVLSTDKTKFLVFNKKGKEKKECWNWEGNKIEKIQSFKYLNFICNRKDDYTDHIKELKRKGRLAANKVWGLGERICRHDFDRR